MTQPLLLEHMKGPSHVPSISYHKITNYHTILLLTYNFRRSNDVPIIRLHKS